MRIYRWFQASLSEESSRKRYYLVYSLAFAALAFVCFSWFILSGKSLLWFVEDGWMQHYKCLVYYGEYLRQILMGLKEEHKEIFYFLFLRQFSPQYVALMRGQTDRNIRKVRDTVLRKIRKKLPTASATGGSIQPPGIPTLSIP